jgi:hypothetical protein
MFNRLHVHLNRLADEVERAMHAFGSSGAKATGTMSGSDA